MYNVAMNQTSLASEPIAALPYSHLEPKPAARDWAGAAIIFGGLGLVLLGGCFLIGVLSIVRPNIFMGPATAPPMTAAATMLMMILYLLAFLCFAGGAVMLVTGTRALLRIIHG
jgi:hypothetical protein